MPIVLQDIYHCCGHFSSETSCGLPVWWHFFDAALVIYLAKDAGDHNLLPMLFLMQDIFRNQSSALTHKSILIHKWKPLNQIIPQEKSLNCNNYVSGIYWWYFWHFLTLPSLCLLFYWNQFIGKVWEEQPVPPPQARELTGSPTSTPPAAASLSRVRASSKLLNRVFSEDVGPGSSECWPSYCLPPTSGFLPCKASNCAWGLNWIQMLIPSVMNDVVCIL